MSERVNALPDEVETFRLPLVVQIFKLNHPLAKQLISELELQLGDIALINDPDANDQFAIMPIVFFWKYSTEEAGTQTIEVEQEFPSFVAAGEFLRRIPRRPIE